MRDELATRLSEAFRWTGAEECSDPSAWWRDASLLADLGQGLASLHAEAAPTIVLGIEASGFVLGPLVAVALGVGFAEVRKDLHPEDVGERLHRRTTAPDHLGRSITLTLRPNLVRPSDRVLVVDDWIETGGQVTAVRDLVEDAEARWVGVATIVDGTAAGTRQKFNVRSLLRESTLSWYRPRR